MSNRVEQIERSLSVHNKDLTQKIAVASNVQYTQYTQVRAVTSEAVYDIPTHRQGGKK